MNKCVKVVIMGIQDVGDFYKVIKRRVDVQGLEGVVETDSEKRVHVVVHGLKALVDVFVDRIGEVVVKYSVKNSIKVDFAVEPFLKTEDYREVFRFMKPEATA